MMTSDLFSTFLVSAVMLVVCVMIHGTGLFALSRALRSEASEERQSRLTPASARGLAFTLAVVLAIFTLHGAEIWLYAMVYLLVGATGSLHDAIYFSTISYTTVGYGDSFIAQEWRLLGAFESILGMLLIGWSTAFFIRMLGRLNTGTH